MADHILMGIVCVDISVCTSTPKSLSDPTGKNGKSWLAFLDYLDFLKYEERPNSITLECVDNLGRSRSLCDRVEKGTLVVIQALKERGYVGQWRKVSPTYFFLPQRRLRVWGLFLKLRRGHGPKAIAARQIDVDQAFHFIESSQTACREPLQNVLGRFQAPQNPKPRKRPKTQSLLIGSKQAEIKFISQHNLSDEDLSQGQAEFLSITSGTLVPRQQAVVWLELCKLRKKGTIPNWKEGLLVADCGSGLGWLTVAKDVFPCVLPKKAYLILEHGEPSVAHGLLCLALQGIGRAEAAAFHLSSEEETLLHRLAGNAFCANICLVYLVAALLFA